MRQRRVLLEGAFNLRDFGGYETADGRTVRHGCVYRSDNLATLTDNDLDTFTALGIRHICDFRNDLEVEAQPSRVPDHPELTIERLPIGDGEGGDDHLLIDRVLAGEVTSFGVEEMVQMYADMLDDHPRRFGTIIDHAADPSRHALLFHCTAGKDRTGVAAALLLGALGVPEEVILDDYVLTTEYRSGPRLKVLRPQLEEAGVDVEALLPFFTAQRPVMEATLAGLRQRHGSVERYLMGPAGVAPATLDGLREVLLEPGSRS